MTRKPKQLGADEQPTVLQAWGDAGGDLARSPASGGGAMPPDAPLDGGAGEGAGAVTDDDAALVAASAGSRPLDPATAARMRLIAGRLALPRPRRDRARGNGGGRLASVPYRGAADDIDLERTLERLVERPVPEREDVVVRARTRARRSVVLLIDVSGSMRGQRALTAAATLGALAGELRSECLAVIAFWSDAAVLARLDDRVSSRALVERLARLPARGLTNVAFPLTLAGAELARAPARDARAVLLSDCVHNAGPDPRPLAARLPRLDVLMDGSGEHDLELAGELAQLGRGRLGAIADHREVAPALERFFAA